MLGQVNQARGPSAVARQARGPSAEARQASGTSAAAKQANVHNAAAMQAIFENFSLSCFSPKFDLWKDIHLVHNIAQLESR